jgi:hypothetical protein
MKTQICEQHPHPYPIPTDRMPTVLAVDMRAYMNGTTIIRFYCIKCGTILDFDLRNNTYLPTKRFQERLRRQYKREIKEIKDALKKLEYKTVW